MSCVFNSARSRIRLIWTAVPITVDGDPSHNSMQPCKNVIGLVAGPVGTTPRQRGLTYGLVP